MARNQASLSTVDKMSVLGESAAAYSSPAGREVGAYPRLHQLEVTSRLERPILAQTWDCRRSVKRPRDAMEQNHNVSTAKKFITEDMVATHLQHLNIASNQSPPSAISSLSSSPLEALSQLASSPLLSSSDCSSLLASAAMSHPLNVRTVASCPRSLELTRDVVMATDNDTATTNDSGGPVGSTGPGRGSTPSLADGTADTDRRTHGSPSLCQREDDDECVRGKSSPPHKRLAWVLDEGEGEERDQEPTGNWQCCWGCLARPYLKRSKVDMRVTAAATNSMNLDLIPNDPQMLTKRDSDTSSQSSSSESDLSSLNGGKRWEPVVLEDGSDSSDGGAEPGPERPLSLWVSPELQAISSNSRRVKDLLPPSILERYHSPKGMELVPWVGPPSAIVRAQGQNSSGSNDKRTIDQRSRWTRDSLTDKDISMEP